MSWINYLIFLPTLAPLALPLYMTDSTNARIRKYIFRQPVVRVIETKRMGRSWLTPVWLNRNGELEGYRYVATKVGRVRLDEATKTGYYCGNVTWEWL